MTGRNFTKDLTILIAAYLPVIESLTSVEKLVLAQCAIYLEMNEGMVDNRKESKQDDLG